MAAPGAYVPSSGNMVAGAIPEQRYGGAGSSLRDVLDLPEVALGAEPTPIGRTDVGFGWFGAASEPETVARRARPPTAEAGGCPAPLPSAAADAVAPDALERSARSLTLRSHCRGAPVSPGALGDRELAPAAATEGLAGAAPAGGADGAPEHPSGSFVARFLEAADRIGRKIPHCYENPVDNWFIDVNERVNPAYHALGLVPNHVTALSAAFGIASVAALARGAYGASAALYVVSYYFDVADGNYARAYGLVSKFGDLLDHVKDVLVVAGLYAVVLFKLAAPLGFKVAFFAAQAVMVLGMLVHLGCQERYYDGLKKKKDGAHAESESASLSGLRALCFLDPEAKMPFTRWIGCGTYAVVTAAWLYAAKWWAR